MIVAWPLTSGVLQERAFLAPRKRKTSDQHMEEYLSVLDLCGEVSLTLVFIIDLQVITTN